MFGMSFTIAEANRVLPEVIKKFENVLAKQEIVKRLDRDVNDAYSITEFMKLKQKLNSALTKLFISIEDLESMGVAIKDLDGGLIDFPSKRFDEEVWLCWTYGESEIKFWHEKDVGFRGRKPIDVSDESLI